jgi:hypothetical protein
MDVRAERTLAVPFWRLEQAVRAGPREWVPNLEEDRAGGLVTEVGVGSGPTWIGRRVALRVGEPACWPGRCAVPISWQAERRPELFPQLAGVLELAPASPDRTLLVLEASYSPPARAAGELADRAVLHRVAEATVRGFLERSARVLERVAEARAAPPEER